MKREDLSRDRGGWQLSEKSEKNTSGLSKSAVLPRRITASKTRRVVAVCCNTPMFLEFSGGHWLSIYGHLWPSADLPALEIRTMTRSRPVGVALPDDVPNPDTHNFSFCAKLLAAWAAMRFRAPSIDFVQGGLDAK